MRLHIAFLLAALFYAESALAASMTVVEARGGSARPGQKIESNASITLREGEKLVLIAPDGRVIALRGPYSGPALRGGGSIQDPRKALTALIALRNERTNSIGAVRSAAEAAKLPEPWWIDISRPGERCIRPSDKIIWWRPDAELADSFSILPLDRSWKADFTWSNGQAWMRSPRLAELVSTRRFLVRQGRRELPIRMNVIASGADEPIVVAAWMLEKGCTQQADALLRQAQSKLEGTPTMETGL